MQTAFTDEIDSPEVAARDIVSQLRLDELRANTVALVTAYWESVETGALTAIAEALPCEMIGCTTLGSSVGYGYGLEQISVSLLTSDDVEFVIALSETIPEGEEVPSARSCYRDLRSKLELDPEVMFAFCPPVGECPSDAFAQALDAESGGVPIFGTTANDTGITFKNARVFYNGEAFGDRLALLALCGNVSPRFFALDFESDASEHIRGVVTKTDGYRLLEINEMPALDYFRSLGVSTVDAASISALPMILDRRDGSAPSGIALFACRDSLMCGQRVPQGSEISVTDFGYNDVMRTAESMIERVRESLPKKSAASLFIISCLSRGLAITPNNENELRLISELLGERMPYMMLYAAGEICPGTGSGSRHRNEYRNLTFAVMALD